MAKKNLQSQNLKIQAYKAIENKDYLKGKKLLEDVIKIEPNVPEVLNDLGLLNFHLNDFDKSIKFFEKALEVKPNFPIAINNLGNVFLKKKDFENATEYYNKAIKIDSKNTHAHYNLGIVHLKKNEIKKAENFFKLAISLDVNFKSAYLNLFELYDKSNQLDKFKELLDKSSEIFANDVMIDFFLGIYEFKCKKYYQTIKILENPKLEKQLDKQRNSIRFEILAKSFDQIGSYNSAYEYFEKANKNVEQLVNHKIINKENFIDLVKKRINYFSNHNFKKWNSVNFKEKNNDPVFIIGFPRSGTTLLDTILRSHPSIEVLEEKPIIDKFIRILEKKINHDLKNLENISESLFQEMRDIYFLERNKYLDFKDKNKLYIDKMPFNIVHVGELLRFFPNSKFIFALRHPNDSVLSCFMQNFSPNDAMINFTSINNTSYLYDLVMTLWIKYSELFSSSIHTIKYEDVVNNFDKMIGDLLNFLNLEWSDNVREFHKTAKQRGIISTPSYNQVNMPLYKNSINRWKNYEKKFLDSKKILDKWVEIFNY